LDSPSTSSSRAIEPASKRVCVMRKVWRWRSIELRSRSSCSWPSDHSEVGARDLGCDLAAGLLVDGFAGAEAGGRRLDRGAEVAHDVEVVAGAEPERVAVGCVAEIINGSADACAQRCADLRQQTRAYLLQRHFGLAHAFDGGAEAPVVLERFLHEGDQLRVLEDAVVGDDGSRIASHRRDGPVSRHACALGRHGFECRFCDGEVAARRSEDGQGARGHATGHVVFNHI
jgi:hypothetical protein